MAALRGSELLTPDQLQTLLDSPARATLRPVGNDALITSVRGVGPEGEMIGGLTGIARTWYSARFVLALIEYDVAGTEAVRGLFQEGDGPRDGAELLAWYAEKLGNRFYTATAAIELRLIDIGAREPLRPEPLKQAQVDLLQIHRHLAPYKVMTGRALSLSDHPFIRPHLQTWREVADQGADTDQLLRLLQQRCLAVHHHASDELARRTNAAALVLALVTTITLPLTLVAAVLDMDVALPGNSHPSLASIPAALSLLAVMVLLVVLAALLVRQHMPVRRQQLDGGRAPPVGREAGTEAPRQGRRAEVTQRLRPAEHLPCKQ